MYGAGHPAVKNTVPNKPHMSHNQVRSYAGSDVARSGSVRSALPFQVPDGSEKCAMGAVEGGRKDRGVGKDRSRLRVGSVNVGSLRGRSDEVVEMVGRRNLDFCCLQETRWRGKNARRIGSYNIFGSGYRRDWRV